MTKLYICVESLSHPVERQLLETVFRVEYMDVEERKRRMGQFIGKVLPLLTDGPHYEIWKVEVQLQALLTPALRECMWPASFTCCFTIK